MLVLDDDDDWDGILDGDDSDPKTLTLQAAYNYALTIDGVYNWYACIEELKSDFPGRVKSPPAVGVN